MPINQKTSPQAAAAHLAVCPFPFGSHPFCLFNLVLRLAKEAPQVHFSFFSTSRTNSTILSSQTTNLPTNIKTYDVDDGMQEGVDHSKLDHTEEVTCFLKRYPANFKRTIVKTFDGGKISCLLIDAVFSFDLGKMAEEDLNVPWIAFMIPSPYDLVAFFQMESVQQLYADVESDDDVIDIYPGLSPIPFKDLPHKIFLSSPSDVIVPLLSSMVQKLPQAYALVLNSYEELNATDLTNYLKSKVQNLLYVGSFNLHTPTSGGADDNGDVTGCLSWLDAQNVASVVYISFGTVAVLAPEELEALAEALEICDIPFLWSLKDSFKEYLPEEFHFKMNNGMIRGKVVPWAPQTKVLGHQAIGVHVTHCGNNSMWESIWLGVPMICRPVWADNHVNAKIVEEMWGIGVRIEGGMITKSGMVKCLEIIFKQEKGNEIRQASTALKQVLNRATEPDGVAAKCFKTLVEIIAAQ